MEFRMFLQKLVFLLFLFFCITINYYVCHLIVLPICFMQSGLTEAVLKSTTTLAQAEKQVLDFLQQHTESGTAPLAGNSVYMDRMFLLKYMPSLTDYLHYRIIDVSTVKELCRYRIKSNHSIYLSALHNCRDLEIAEVRFLFCYIFHYCYRIIVISG